MPQKIDVACLRIAERNKGSVYLINRCMGMFAYIINVILSEILLAVSISIIK
jgi:hypothetical protein